MKDLANKLIKATTESFLEDPLRVYRVARLASILNFDVDKNTIQMMKSIKGELNTLSKERVFIEFSKALSSTNPSVFFNILREADLLEVHFKEIYNLIGVMQPIEHHPEGDAYSHTMLVLDKSAEQTNELEIRFASLVHDLGKGITPKEEYPHHYNHEINGVKLVEKFGERINAPKKWVECGKVACREHMRGGIFYKMRPSKKVDYIERIAKSKIGLKGMQIVVNSDKLSSRNTDEVSINFEEIGTELLNKINGKYIKEKFNIEAGIAFKEKLREERIKYIKENFIKKSIL